MFVSVNLWGRQCIPLANRSFIQERPCTPVRSPTKNDKVIGSQVDQIPPHLFTTVTICKMVVNLSHWKLTLLLQNIQNRPLNITQLLAPRHHDSGRREPDRERQGVLEEFGSGETGLPHEIADPERSPAPALDHAPAIERARDERIPGSGLVFGSGSPREQSVPSLRLSLVAYLVRVYCQIEKRDRRPHYSDFMLNQLIHERSSVHESNARRAFLLGFFPG